MILSLPNKLLLLALHGLPANVLFSQRSLVEGYVTTPCTECDSPIATRDGEPIPELCDRPSCYKFDRFSLACLAVSIRQGGFRTIHHHEKFSLVVKNTPTLRYILAADAEVGFWLPRCSTDRKRFSIERMRRSRKHITLRPPVWTGDERPRGARRVRLQSNFPSQILVTELCDALAYPREAASAFFARAHAPWMVPKPDRRKSICPSLSDIDETPHGHYASVPLAQPAHPYNPSSPSRRTLRGGGFTQQQVRNGLQRMRTDDTTKTALFEIVYNRRSPLQVSDESRVPVEILHVYSSRLRKRIRTDAVHT